jgi:hypothetical protein
VSDPERIVPVDDLPDSLWRDAKLFIAPALAEAYCDLVRARDLSKLAAARDSKSPPVGGLTREQADKHLAQGFDGSVARTALALLDPKCEVARVADALATACAGGRLAILDVPSGAGAFSLSVLCGLAELRAVGVVPRLPLDVVVVGGEISPYASAHATDLFRSLVPRLAEQAIHVSHKTVKWDVCSADSTAQLLKRFVADADEADRKLVAVSNFTGFLGKTGKRKQAEPQLQTIFRLSSGPTSTCIWLEPQTNVATQRGGVLQWVADTVRRLPGVERFFEAPTESGGSEAFHSKTEALFARPLSPRETATARLAVLRFDLPGVEP